MGKKNICKMKDLEYRMYGLVPYNLSPIQQGIQFGHAVVEYGLKEFEREPYQDWAVRDKTFIILNGGTTNDNPIGFGTLNRHYDQLRAMDVRTATFHEPDLGDQLTAVVFLLDERVWDKEKYPDFKYIFRDKDTVDAFKDSGIKVEDYEDNLSFMGQFNESMLAQAYEGWVERIGGESNLFLRQFIKQFRLA